MSLLCVTPLRYSGMNFVICTNDMTNFTNIEGVASCPSSRSQNVDKNGIVQVDFSLATLLRVALPHGPSIRIHYCHHHTRLDHPFLLVIF